MRSFHDVACTLRRRSAGWAAATGAKLSLAVALVFFQPAIADRQVDLIWVNKSDYLLHLIIDQEIVASYPIALGKTPLGHKRQRNDGRTPEGLYFVDYRNEQSDYFLSLHISYPNERDRRHALHRGVDPGGDIVIHGEPNEMDKRALLSEAANRRNWTEGCIALSNEAMVALWQSVDEGTPVLIEP